MFISHQTADQSLTSVCVCVCSLSVCQHLWLSLSGCCLHADMLSPLFLSSGKDMQFDFDIILKPGLWRSVVEGKKSEGSAPVGTADHTVLIDHFTLCVGIETTQHLIGSGRISYIECPPFLWPVTFSDTNCLPGSLNSPFFVLTGRARWFVSQIHLLETVWEKAGTFNFQRILSGDWCKQSITVHYWLILTNQINSGRVLPAAEEVK